MHSSEEIQGSGCTRISRSLSVVSNSESYEYRIFLGHSGVGITDVNVRWKRSEITYGVLHPEYLSSSLASAFLDTSPEQSIRLTTVHGPVWYQLAGTYISVTTVLHPNTSTLTTLSGSTTASCRVEGPLGSAYREDKYED